MISDILSKLMIDKEVASYIESVLQNDPTDLESVALLLENMEIDHKPALAQIEQLLLSEPHVHTKDVEEVGKLSEKVSMGGATVSANLPTSLDTFIENKQADSSDIPVDSIKLAVQDADELALQTALDDTDDFASAWQECKDTGRAWGGRGFGGRGVARQYQCASKGFTRDVKIDGVTLAFAGKELLTRTKLSLTAGHRYALLGRNGVGKSTLIRRIASGSLPGFPPHLTIAYLAQEPPAPTGEAALRSSLDALLIGACKKRRLLLEVERDDLEKALQEGGGAEEYDEAAIVQRLGEVDDELEELSLSNGKAQDNCFNMLKELGFDSQRMNAAVGTLSGGWRMRVELASALIAHTDILLLDEPTNHLDLKGVLWLEEKLTSPGKSPSPTVIVVSHDRAFVAAIATDIIVMEHQTLRYFDGGLEAFEQHEEEAAAAYEHRLDARVRQETAARDAAAKMKQKAQKSGNDNAMRAAKQRLAKVERVGLYRDDGKRFKTRSLAKLDEQYSLLPSKVEAKLTAKQDVFSFPEPQAFPADRPLVSLDMVSLRRGEKEILKSVNAFLYPGTRAAIVGDNGAGKTTILQALVGNILPCAGTRTLSPGCRVAYVSQHHADDLIKECTSVDSSEGAAAMLARKFRVSELEARAKLGKFGITGGAALLPLKSLSGGQRVRVSLASITWDSPDVLLLDEPTNHCDMNALDALATALSEYKGAVAVVSHNRSFLTACCTELWVVDKGTVRIDRPPAGDESPEAFAQLFSDYASRVLGNGTGGVGSSHTITSKASRAASALDSASKAKKRGGNLKSAGAASNRAGFL